MDSIQFHIDQAGFENVLRSSTVNFFTGWVVNLNDTNPINHVRFNAGKAVLGTLPIKHDRPDLMKVFQKTLLGFWGAIMIPEEFHHSILRIEAVAKDGTTFFMKEYVVEETVPFQEMEFKKLHNVPDDMLRQLVVANIDPYTFIEQGKQGVELIKQILQKNGVEIDSFRNILDFGVGCGRIMRWWEGTSSRISLWGTDINEKLIDWCKQNIRFAKFTVNPLHPPTGFESNQFDFLYAFSVFTHLGFQTQTEWICELSRILGPKGYALISVHGDSDARQLSKESREEYERQGFIVMSDHFEGENMCAVYQNRAVSEQLFSKYFDVIDYLPAALRATSSQDLFLLKKN